MTQTDENLRRIAEARLSAETTRIDATHKDLPRLLHELQVHQIELEMQNNELRETRAALEISLSRYTELYDFAPVGYFSLDRDGSIQQLNLSGARLLGKDRVMVSGRRFAEFLSSDTQAVFTEWMRSSLTSRVRQTCDIQLSGVLPRTVGRYLRLDGQCEDGQTVLIAATDISARKQAEAELELYRQHLEELVAQRTAEIARTEAKASLILQSSADGLYGVDLDGNITFINAAACTLLGCDIEQVIGQNAHKLFHHSKPDGSFYPADTCPSHAALQSGQEIRSDNEVYWHADGHAVPVMYVIHPMFQDGKVNGAVINFFDVSVQRAAAEARDQALVAAVNLARLRSEFVANMSHELRTPLNGVLGFAQIGMSNYQNPEKSRHAFGQTLNSGQILLGVINDILDFSKIEAGKLNIEQTEIKIVEVIRQVVDLTHDRVLAKHLSLLIKLERDLPKTCVSDPLRLGQVLLNLVANAIKFTEVGSVTLSARLQADKLVFRVADTGIGMSPTQLGQLFVAFQQADGSTTRKFGGTGLGLVISKRIVEMMGGELRVESQTGIGSSFEFSLPYVAAESRSAVDIPASPASPASNTSQPLAGLSILVAEDDLTNQAVLESMLTSLGARLVMVNNGREAVERVTRDGARAYDIVLMDVQMPEMDGYEATRQILKLAPALPIIGQTAHAMAEEKAKCLAAGMADHIAKPINFDMLVEMILLRVAADTLR